MATFEGADLADVPPLVADVADLPLGPLEQLVLNHEVVGVDLSFLPIQLGEVADIIVAVDQHSIRIDVTPLTGKVDPVFRR